MMILILMVLFIISIWVILKSRNMHLWILSYINNKFSQLGSKSNPNEKHIYLCVADHFEPFWRNTDRELAIKRVRKWSDNYYNLAKKYTDSNGNHPVHTFFYPEEEYDEEIMSLIKGICNQGVGDVEIHLHHDNDTKENLTKTLNDFKKILYEKHGLLRKNDNGEIIYAFIHGNWALDNSLPNKRWCGVDNEISVLLDTGCYMDMTMPSAPSPTQSKIVNNILLAKGKDGCSKNYDHASIFSTGSIINKDQLLMIQGPVELNWGSRKFGVIPRIETGELSYDAPPTLERIKLWIKSNNTVRNNSNNIFIKLHTHGAQENNSDMFFDGGFEKLWSGLNDYISKDKNIKVHYVSAWDMYKKVIEISHSNL